MSPNGVRWALSRCWRSVAVNVAGNRHEAADAPVQVRNEGVVRLTIQELASRRRSRLSRASLTLTSSTSPTSINQREGTEALRTWLAAFVAMLILPVLNVELAHAQADATELSFWERVRDSNKPDELCQPPCSCSTFLR